MSTIYRVRYSQAVLSILVLFWPLSSYSMQLTEELTVSPALLPAAGQYKEQYLSKTLNLIRQQGEDGNSITQSLIDAQRNEIVSSARGRFFAATIENDRDGDGVISLSEIEESQSKKISIKERKSNPERRELRTRKAVKKVLAADSNGDNKITLIEAYEHAKLQSRASRSQRNFSQMEDFLALDPNKDGTLTARELKSLAVKAFDKFDVNNNQRIDQEEFKVIKDRRQKLKKKRASSPSADEIGLCKLPTPKEKDEVIVISSAGGDAVSSVSVSGMGSQTTFGVMNIEPGDTKLYIYSNTSNSMIWRVEGAVERISQLVLGRSSERIGVGVVGLPKAKLTFLKPKTCSQSFTKKAVGKVTKNQSLMETVLQRSVTAMLPAGRVSTLQVPSGIKKNRNKRYPSGVRVVQGADRYVLTKPVPVNIRQIEVPIPVPDGVREGMWRRLLLDHPDAIETIVSENVVSETKVENYDVMPGWAGLVQLHQEGKITQLNDGVFLILEVLGRFPHGLQRDDVKEFILGRGIPAPSNLPIGICLTDEKTKAPLEISVKNCRNL